MTAPQALELSAFREDQVPRGSVVYLDYARRGPLLRAAHDALQGFIPSLHEGSVQLDDQARIRESARARLATLVGVSPRQLAFTSNTTTAIAQLAQSVRWAPGDRVLLAPDEVASNRLPWLALEARGVQIHQLPSRQGRLDLHDLERTCHELRPRWFSLSFVSLDTGQLRPVQQAIQIVKASGGRVCVDVAQAAGVLRLQEALRGADAVAGCGRKWLCGPPEVGFLALPSGDDGLFPVSAGMRSLDGRGELLSGALAWEGGVEPVLALVGLEASLRAREALSEESLESAALQNARTLRELLGSQVPRLPAAEVSPIVWVEAKGPIQPGALLAEGLALRSLGDKVRVSAHAWSTSEELEQAVAVLKGL